MIVPPQIRLVLKFVVHTVVGILLFSVAGTTAVCLNYLTGLIEETHVSPYILSGVQGLEFLLFAADFICLLVFLIRETIMFLVDVWRSEGTISHDEEPGRYHGVPQGRGEIQRGFLFRPAVGGRTRPVGNSARSSERNAFNSGAP